LCTHAYGKPGNREKLIAVEREIPDDLKKMLTNPELSASQRIRALGAKHDQPKCPNAFGQRFLFGLPPFSKRQHLTLSQRDMLLPCPQILLFENMHCMTQQ
jgi:hypothetical protein